MRQLQLVEEGGMCGDSLTANVFDEVDWRLMNGRLCLDIDNPWSGDTEHGFGCSASIMLTKEQARELAAYLLEYADSQD